MSNPNLFLFQQPIDYPLVTGTAVQVVTTAEAKLALRIDVTTEDNFIASLISTATNYFEMVSGRDLINKTYKCFLNNFPIYGWYPATYAYSADVGIVIKKSKLQSITSIEYYLDGVLTTFSSAKYYITDETGFASIYLVDGESYPTEIDNRQQAIKITFVAGYGAAASAVPEDIKQIITQMVVYLYENRGDCNGDCSKLPSAMQNLILNRKIIDL